MMDQADKNDSAVTKRFKWSDAFLLAVVWIAMVAITNPIGDFPQNDDWVYALAVESILKNGRFEVLSMTSANFGPLAYWGALFSWLFGFSYTALRFSTLVLGLAGVIALYALVIEVWQERRIALVLALAVMVNPVFFALANTFMTDVPFVALMIAAMLAIAAGLARGRTGLIVLGIALAIFTVFVRQFALIVLVGFAAAWVARNGARPKALVIALVPLGIGLLCHYLFTRWLVESGRKPHPPAFQNPWSISPNALFWQIRFAVFATQSYLGLFLIPLAVLCFPRRIAGLVGRRHNWRVRGAVALAALLIGAFYMYTKSWVPVGENTLNAYGIGPLLIGDAINGKNLPEPTYFALLGWKAATVLAVGSSACLVVALCIAIGRAAGVVRKGMRQTRSPGFVQGAFVGGVAAAYAAILLVVAIWYPLFDRYLLPLTVLAGFAMPFLITRNGAAVRPDNGRWVLALLLVAGIGCFTVVATHDYLRWGDTRWRALKALMQQGISPQRIDGGYEFNGTYLYDPSYKIVRPKSWWWVADDEYLISGGPVPGYAQIERMQVDRWWESVGKDVFVLRRISPAASASR